jgi:excisionase family DNA binding protein
MLTVVDFVCFFNTLRIPSLHVTRSTGGYFKKEANVADEKLKTATEIEMILGIPKDTLYRQARSGRVPSYRVGPKGCGVRFTVHEIKEALRRPQLR